ncbi:MAG TPA: hypothetical protein VM840_03440 [Actinomycetota bacterium]|nr:hypothetical protein [Actinomycetota bacterium]
MRDGGSVWRRYPALAYLVGAGLLAVLLPSALTLPQGGPETLAEYAPVTGDGDGAGDMSGLGQAGSGGLGFGSAGRVSRGDLEDLATGASGGTQRKPGTKRCVGQPPQQTEDPMSPPCSAFFEGSNPGATAKGVTAEEVQVLVQYEKAASDQKNQPVDCAGDVRDDDDHLDRLCRAYMRFFNDRYQTYDRRVRLWSGHGDIGKQWADIDAKIKPFAKAGVGYTSEALETGTMAVAFQGAPRTSYRRRSPGSISFRQDLDDQSQLAATYICLRLAGGKARYAGDPTMHDDPRRFGLWAAQRNQIETTMLMAALKERCGIEPYALYDWQDATGAAQMQREGVTSVIVHLSDTSVATVTQAASRQGWFPEWIVPGSNRLLGLDTNFLARTFPVQAQWANAIGLTFDLRRAEISDQPWHRAYREGCPDCPPLTGTQTYAAIQGYESMAMLFYGIQAAGPRLTYHNLVRGLEAIPPRQSTNPYAPAAYFAPGNSSYLKDAAAIWWDPSGQPPGSAAKGCWRLPQDGRRYRAGEWPEGDSLVKAPGPCQGEVTPG